MAKIEFDLPEDYLETLLDSDFEEIARDALESNVSKLQESVKRECASVISDKERTELVDSVKVWKGGVKKTKTDAYMIGVSFYGKPKKKSTWNSSSTGKDRKTTNNDIAWWLEHGSRHQSAKPFIDRASRNVESTIMNKIQETYNKKVGI